MRRATPTGVIAAMVIAIAAGSVSGANPAQADALVDGLLSTWSRRVIALPPADVPDDSLGDLLETLALLGPVGPGAQRPVRGPLIPLAASIRIDALSGPLLEDWLDWPEPPPAGAAAGLVVVHYTDGFDTMPQGKK